MARGKKGETYGGWDGNKIAFSRPVLVSLLGKCNQFVCWLVLLLLLDNKDAHFNLEPAGRKCKVVKFKTNSPVKDPET